MGVTDTTNTVKESGNGVKVAFDFDFKIFETTELEVSKIDTSSLIATLQTITTDYTVAINTTTEGGIVTYVTAPTSGEQSFIKRVMPLTQTTDVPTEGTIPEDSLNNEYDRSRMIDIQQQEEMDRTIKFVETSDLSDVNLPEGTSAANRASKVIAYDSAGTGLELVSTQTGTNVDPIAVQGDIAQGGVTGAAEKLAIGATGSMLSVVAGKWATFAVGATSAVQQIVAGVPAWVTNPILLIPTIADFTSATHDHSGASGGGDLGDIQATSLTLTGTTETDTDTLVKGNIIKGWVSFNGTTFAEKDSFNVFSLTDNGTGDYTITWDTDFANANYCVVGMSEEIPGSSNNNLGVEVVAAGYVDVRNVNNDSSNVQDCTQVHIMAIGDQ